MRLVRGWRHFATESTSFGGTIRWLFHTDYVSDLDGESIAFYAKPVPEGIAQNLAPGAGVNVDSINHPGFFDVRDGTISIHVRSWHYLNPQEERGPADNRHVFQPYSV